MENIKNFQKILSIEFKKINNLYQLRIVGYLKKMSKFFTTILLESGNLDELLEAFSKQ